MGARVASVLALNAGSSSVKAALFAIEDGSPRRLARAAATGVAAGGHGRAAADVLDELQRDGRPRADAVGHRLVHGGSRHAEPALLDGQLLEELKGLVPYAPLHLPAGLAAVAAARERLPAVPHVACFDTAFHRTMPEAAQRLPLPQDLWEEGIRSYGFHGLSYEHVVETVGAAGLARGVIAHLGSGASLAAVAGGRSLDTTMSFTPTAGVVMGTRSGDLDPGLLVYLAAERGYDGDRLRDLVEHRAGLLGVSGTSADMRQLLAAAADDRRAALAVELFCRSVAKHAAALVSVLGGLDTLVFTGGIGEGSPAVRAGVCARLAHLGVAIEADANEAGEAVLSPPGRRPLVRLVHADEEAVIARHTARLAAA